MVSVQDMAHATELAGDCHAGGAVRIVEIGPAEVDLLLAVTPGLFDEDIRPDQRALSKTPTASATAYDGDLAVGWSRPACSSTRQTACLLSTR